MNRKAATAILLLSESAQASMIAAAVKADPNETGGILIGVHTNGGHPWVTRAIEIATNDRGHHHYKIPSGATQPSVYAARRTDSRLGYLGDWHSHPADIGPSPTDLATLAVYSIKHPLTPNPTLIVVRNTPDGRVLDARRIVTVTPRSCDLHLTGDLPEEPPTPGTTQGDPRAPEESE
ncbi:Mov34/MPN/PAD-1 family protein [Kribbella sp. NPDC006257]|uniref:Mov34/MPN/PAD-1 family protein n=1 Tax=Kribbella sp. NPDC006257 TaxID=3156738 RepID=UPI0033B91BF9